MYPSANLTCLSRLGFLIKKKKKIQTVISVSRTGVRIRDSTSKMPDTQLMLMNIVRRCGTVARGCSTQVELASNPVSFSSVTAIRPFISLSLRILICKIGIMVSAFRATVRMRNPLRKASSSLFPHAQWVLNTYYLHIE